MKSDARKLAKHVVGLEDRLDVLVDLLQEMVAQQNPQTQDKRAKYMQAILRIRVLSAKLLPAGATVLVASKGDTELLRAVGTGAGHFPQTAEGVYAGHHPANSSAAIIHLEALRNRGAKFLLLPSTSLWWFDHYPQFRRHLENNYRLLARADETCALYDLRPRRSPSRWQSALCDAIAECRSRVDREPGILDWNTGLNLTAMCPQDSVFSPPKTGAVLPYMESSVDLVVVRTSDSAILNEARRVAGAAVVQLRPHPRKSNAFDVSVEWQGQNKTFAFPSVSIIIPTFNGLAHLRGCLKALKETVPADLPVEIIVVDDASRDGTADYLQRFSRREPRLKIVANSENVGVIHSCNRGAATATGEYLVFLNNDTVPLKGWLAPLLRTFRDYPDAGVVGGKLVYPDGRLQEAGGVLFSDGSGARFGHNSANSHDPLFNFVRDVDYCSRSLLATRRDLFQELGGFETFFSSPQDEDKDYCLKVRHENRRAYYQPESTAIHWQLAGDAIPREANVGRPADSEPFARRWIDSLQHQPRFQNRDDYAAWLTLAARGQATGASSI